MRLDCRRRTQPSWSATAYLETEKNFKRIDGHQDLWILKAALDQKHAPHLEMLA